MLHSLLWRNTFGVVVPEHHAEKFKGLVADESCVLLINELVPWLTWVLRKDLIVVSVKRQIVLIQIGKEIISSENFRDLHELIVVVSTLEERFLFENDTSKHATKGPNIKGVIISLVINEKLGSFEVATSHTDVVLLTWVIKFS